MVLLQHMLGGAENNTRTSARIKEIPYRDPNSGSPRRQDDCRTGWRVGGWAAFVSDGCDVAQ
jgi:hypothetical protein